MSTTPARTASVVRAGGFSVVRSGQIPAAALRLARAVSRSSASHGHLRPATIASLISGFCPHRFGRPPAYREHGSVGPQAHLCRMYS